LAETPSGSRFVAFAAEFPVIFFCQYGVLHDGRTPYPGALAAMKTLRARGARIVILSNSGRSGAYNASRMAKLGFPPQLYDRLVTSSDVAKSLLLEGKLPIAIRATTRCLTLSSSGSHELADELGLTSVDDAAEADSLLVSGSQADKIPLEDYSRRMAPAAARAVRRQHDAIGVVQERRQRLWPAGPADRGQHRGVWVKTKFLNRQEFIVVGWTDPEGSRSSLGSLLLGYYRDDGKLIYAGRAGTGMTVSELTALLNKLRPLAADKMTVDVPPPRATRFGMPLVLSRVHWFRPELVAEVTYLTWTADGLLRHVVYEGLREDKYPRDVRRTG
jgi:hypothetical protein